MMEVFEEQPLALPGPAKYLKVQGLQRVQSTQKFLKGT